MLRQCSDLNEGCKYWSVYSEWKYFIQMHILTDQRMHKIQDCEPNPNTDWVDRAKIGWIGRLAGQEGWQNLRYGGQDKMERVVGGRIGRIGGGIGRIGGGRGGRFRVVR